MRGVKKMKLDFRKILPENKKIIAVKDEKALDEALESNSKIIFL